MNASGSLFGWLRYWEGRDGKPVLEAYDDGGGVYTIGYGHTMRVSRGDTCTLDQAEQWLVDEVTATASAVFIVVAVKLTQWQFDAITAFAYNIGLHAFMHGGNGGSPSRVLSALNAGEFRRAMDLHADWCHDNGVINAGLVHRRAAERAMFETANYSLRP
jgi:lysozyme